MTRLRIVHRTGFVYDQPATTSYNEARMLPQTGDEQWVLQAALEINPVAAQQSYQDYWGTRVSTFEVLTPHTELSVTATSVVEVRQRPEDLSDIDWETLAKLPEHNTMFVEFTKQTARTSPPAAVRSLAQAIRKKHSGVREVARELCRQIGEQIEYVPGVTGVHSTAEDAWEQRKGVCQDIAHLTVGALRSLGIPARYVSGYLHPKVTPELGEAVLGESHAWVEWYAGSWQGYDPTNLIEIGDRHVYVGRGRDYVDVAPLRGVYAGPSSSALFVSVEITREA